MCFRCQTKMYKNKSKGKPRRQFISKYAYSHRRVNCKSSSLPNMLMSTGGQRSSSCGGVVKLSFYRSSRGKWATVHWRYTQESTFTEMHHSTTSRKFLSLKQKIFCKTVSHKYSEFQTLKSNSSSETPSKFFLC